MEWRDWWICQKYFLVFFNKFIELQLWRALSLKIFFQLVRCLDWRKVAVMIMIKITWLGESLRACPPNDFIVWHLSIRNSTCYSNHPFNASKSHRCRSDGLLYPPLSLVICLIFHSLPQLFSSVKQKTAIGSLLFSRELRLVCGVIFWMCLETGIMKMILN